MWNAKQLELIKTIVADYHIELAGKQDAFKADMPANLQTKALNYQDNPGKLEQCVMRTATWYIAEQKQEAGRRLQIR